MKASDEPTPSLALSLRLRARLDPEGAARIDAFEPSRYGDRSTLAAYRGLSDRRAAPGELVLDEIEGTSVRVSRARRGPVIRVGSDPILPVFFASSQTRIPEIGADLEPPEVIHWNFRDTQAGVLALTSVDGRGLPRPARGLTLVAALVPLTFAPILANAAPGTGGALPILHQPATDSGVAEASGPGVEPAPNAAAIDPNAGPDTATSAPVVAPTEVAAADSGIWGALIGTDLRLTLRDGSTFEGRLLGVHGSALIAARAPDGLVVAVNQSEVAQANAITQVGEGRPKMLPPAPGNGLLIGGAIMTAVAGGLIVGGIAAGAYCAAYGGSYYYGYGSPTDNTCWYYWVPFVVPGAALAAGGIPMIIVGKKRRDAWRKKIGVAQLSPQLRRTRTGWTGGISLRF